MNRYLDELESRLSKKGDVAGLIGKANVSALIHAVRAMARSLDNIDKIVDSEDGTGRLDSRIEEIFSEIDSGLDAAEAICQAKRKRRRGNRKPWSRVMLHSELRCSECGSLTGLTRDHINPLSRGGAKSLSNIQVLCQDCNVRKGNTLPNNQ